MIEKKHLDEKSQPPEGFDIVKSRRLDSIFFGIFGMGLFVWGTILLINGDNLAIPVITLSFAVMFFVITMAQSASSTMEYRELVILMTMTMKKIDDLGRKLDESLKHLEKKEPRE